VDAAECVRFDGYLVNGPHDADCTIWAGAIGADGCSHAARRKPKGSLEPRDRLTSKRFCRVTPAALGTEICHESSD
jgi:hypothetical protein